MKTVIIDYGAGNVFSVQSALARLGVNGFLTNEKNEILSADRVIFPGVGHASSALKQLRETKLDQLIPSLKQPVLGVCLGMQLMCEHTQEGNENGLGVFEEVMVKRFEGTLKIPHMVWKKMYISFTLILHQLINTRWLSAITVTIFPQQWKKTIFLLASFIRKKVD